MHECCIKTLSDMTPSFISQLWLHGRLAE